jgi:2-polyprenyl-6-methoxyphenol hydroxylase-like FAD-dependent oxidoreductase
VVVGAGPVGLLLACRLAQRGIATVVLERRVRRSASTRAIGVHPPGLAALDAVGVGAAIRAGAVRVRRASAWGVDGLLAHLDLEPAGEVLTVAQPHTEHVLEERLVALDGAALHRAHEVIAVSHDGDGVSVRARTPEGERTWRAAVVVGCDGRRSRVRDALGVTGRGGPYADRYVMADVVTAAGDAASRLAGPGEAVIHLDARGVIESFPLSGARRWVAHVGGSDASDAIAALEASDAAAVLTRAVRERLGLSFAALDATGAAAFGIERFLADRFAVGRVALAGDAAHVVSPIGGQGMNLGWLDAMALAAAIERGAATGGDAVVAELARYGVARRRRARVAIWRAECNTRLGRPSPLPRARARDALLRLALRAPTADALRGLFTMRGLA